MTGKKEAPQYPKKQPYRAPKLMIHGDLRTMTKAKAGCMTDGTGKPDTRSSGADG